MRATARERLDPAAKLDRVRELQRAHGYGRGLAPIVAQHFGVSNRTAARYIAQARQAAKDEEQR